MSRLVDDLPPTATDDELVAWSRQLLVVPPKRPNRPLVAERNRVTMTTEEVFADIAQRASAAHNRMARKKLIVRR